MRALAWNESYLDCATENVGRTSANAGNRRAPGVVCPGDKSPGFTSMNIGRGAPRGPSARGREGGRHHAFLEEAPRAGGRVLEAPPRAGDGCPAIAFRIPYRAEPRREVVLARRVGAAGPAAVARIDQPRRRSRE